MAAVSIFVSHSNTDDAFSHHLVASLSAAGADVWFDKRDFDHGGVIEAIEHELRRRPIFIVVLSPAALASKWVELECKWAFLRRQLDPTRIILPVLARPIKKDDLWLYLLDFKRIGATSVKPYPQEEAIARTLRALALTLPNEETAAPLPKPANTAESLWERVRVLLAHYRYRDALPLIEQILKLDPDSFEAWASKARVHDELSQGKEALTAADRALQINPQSAMAWASRAGALFQLKRPLEGLTSAEIATLLDPTDVVARLNIGATLLELKRFYEALSAFEQALELDPKYSNAWTGKGHALLGLGRSGDALSAYYQSIKFDPENPEAWTGVGNALMDRLHYKEAERAFRQAISFDESNARAWIGIGNVFLHTGLPSVAENAYMNALSLNGPSRDICLSIAAALRMLGKPEEAQSFEEQARELATAS